MKKYSKYLLPLILLIAIFTRFYRIDATITFLEDEGRDLLVVKKMLDTGRPIALGPQTSTGNMYLGPFYYYFITPALFISNFHPLGPAYLIAITGVITTYLLYRFTYSWFGKKSAILAAFMYSIMPAPVHMTRNSWNPNLMPLVSLLFIYLYILSLKKSSRKYSILLGIMAGILVQLHYMSLILFVPMALYYLAHHRKKIKKQIISIIFMVFGFLIPLAPFIIFEVKNEFVNTSAIVRFIKSEDNPNIRYTAPLDHVIDRSTIASKRLFGSIFGKGSLSPESNSNLILIGFLLLIIISLFKQKNREHKILTFLLLGSLLVIGLYQENIHLHYLGFLFPLVFLLTSNLTNSKIFLLRAISWIAIFISLIYVIPQTIGYLRSGSTNQLIRPREAAKYISEKSEGRKYNVISDPDTNTSPYQYYLSLQANTPSNELQETLFVICQDKPCNPEFLDSKLIFITGPSHPSITEYLYHPLYNYFPNEIVMLSNEHISNGVWVAETRIIIE